MRNSTTNRRSLLKQGALALTAAALPLASSLPRPVMAAQEQTRTLARVNVASNRIIRQVTGLRPFRPSGFVVKAEPLGEKTVIHNYGHGGCGVTLSWGTADLATTLALQSRHRQAAIIGCGAVGLATARLLQDRGFQVTIYTKDLPLETVSNVAGALFAPTFIVDAAHQRGPIVERLHHATRFAFRYFQNFVGEKYGVRWLETFLIGDEPQQAPWDFEIMPDVFPLTAYPPGEHPFPRKHASSVKTMMIQPTLYLPQLLEDFLQRGGKLQVRNFESRTALAQLKQPLVFNCTGLGARELFADRELIPVKGQLTLLLPQPEINYAYVDGRRDLYMFPRQDLIVLGGSHEEGVWSTNVEPAIDEKVLAGHQQISRQML